MMNDQRYITETIDVHDYQQSQVYCPMEITKPELDLNYLNTLSGMLKCICIVSGVTLENFSFFSI